MSTLSLVSSEVKQILIEAEAGHDWNHIQRVCNNAELISDGESDLDMDVVRLAALLHDIADSKFHDGDELIGPRIAEEIMAKHKIDQEVIFHVIQIIKHMSFKNHLGGTTWTSPELRVVQDADRLDAIGAIGIARAFNYGGFKNHSFYDFDIPPAMDMTKEQYKKNTAPTVNHFYEKLLKLTDLMNTGTAKRLARERHDFMITYLNQLYLEIGQRPEWHKRYE